MAATATYAYSGWDTIIISRHYSRLELRDVKPRTRVCDLLSLRMTAKPKPLNGVLAKFQYYGLFLLIGFLLSMHETFLFSTFCVCLLFTYSFPAHLIALFPAYSIVLFLLIISSLSLSLSSLSPLLIITITIGCMS